MKSAKSVLSTVRESRQHGPGVGARGRAALRLRAGAALLLALLAAAPAFAIELPIGAKTEIQLSIANRSKEEVKGLRLEATSGAPWLTVEAARDLPPLEPGAIVRVPLACAVAASAQWSDEAALTLALAWPGDTGERRWIVLERIVAAPKSEEMGAPRELSWHLVEAPRGSERNEVAIAVKNTGDATLAGFRIETTSTSDDVVAEEPVVLRHEGAAGAEKRGEGDASAVAPGATATFRVRFAVRRDTAPGATAVLRLRASAAVRTTPATYEPAVLIFVRGATNGAPGNFEGSLFFEPPPRVLGGATATAELLPVPKGTELTITQVYMYPGPEGLEKPVEQLVGTGNVLDERGFFRLRVDPVGGPPFRFRVIAETIANGVVAVPEKADPDRIASYRVLRPRAAVTPFGKRTYRVVSEVLLAAEVAAEAAEKGRRMIRVLPGQETKGVSGQRIALPFHPTGGGKGILIDWEGELTTGGQINPFSEATSGYGALGELRDSYGQELQAQGGIPGLYWHNRTELLLVLSALVRAQDYLLALPRVATGTAAEDAPGGPTATAAPREPPPVIALWKPGLDLSPGETGYWLREDGTWRLAVQGTAADPDEADPDLILRGYGAAVRHHLFRTAPRLAAEGAPSDEGKPRRTLYAKRSDVKTAFEQGFDTYFSCAVRSDGRLRNEHAASAGLVKERSVDLDEAFGSGGARGLDSPLAVAAGLWRAHRAIGDALLAELLDRGEPGVPALVEICARRAPAVLADLGRLGLLPKAIVVPDPALAQGPLSPREVVIGYDGEGLLGKAGGTEIEAALEARADGASGVRRLPMALDDRRFGTATFGDFDAGGGPPSPWPPGATVRWRFVTTVKGAGAPLRLVGPYGSFTARVDGAEIGAAGGALRLPGVAGGSGGTLAIPPGALASAKLVSVEPRPFGGEIDGRAVVGGAIFEVSDTAFARPAKLTLRHPPSLDDPAAAAPSIFRFDAGRGTWEDLGGEPGLPGEVSAAIDHASTFALLLDRTPPALATPDDGLLAGPDPFDPASARPWRVRFRLSRDAAIGAEITDARGLLLRTIARAEPLGPGLHEVAWDGRDEAGKSAPDGTYGFVVRARGKSGLAALPLAGAIHVFRGVPGAAVGVVRPEGRRVAIRSATGALTALAGPGGRFSLFGLAPGPERIVFESEGLFPEEREVLAREAADVDVGEVALTDRATDGLRVEPEIFSDDPAVVTVRWTRAVAEAEVVVEDARGAVRRRLFAGPVRPGPQMLAWDGRDDRGAPYRGVHAVLVRAIAGGAPVVQERRPVVVDRGLVAYARALPRIFSPATDGFADTTTVAFVLGDAATVTARIFDEGGAVVRTLLRDQDEPEGLVEAVFDGRSDAGLDLPEARYRFGIEARYRTGHAARPAEGEIVIDRKPPRILTIEPSNGTTLAGGRPALRARVEVVGDLDPGSLRFQLDGYTIAPDAYDAASGWFTLTPRTSLGEGVHVLLAYARDLAENLAEPAATSFAVKLREPDRERPTASITAPAQGAAVYTARPAIEAVLFDGASGIDADSIRLAIDGVDVPNTVTRFIPGRSGKSWDVWQYQVAEVLYDPIAGRVRFNPMERLAPGRHTVRLDATDRRGNRAARAEAAFSNVLDETPPLVRIEGPARGARLLPGPIALAASASDAGGSGLDPERLALLVDGVPVPITSGALVGGAVRAALPPLAPGAEHEVRLSIADRAGNTGGDAASFEVLLDRDPPVLLIEEPREEDGGAVLAPGSLAIRGRAWDDGAGFAPGAVRVRVDGRALAAEAVRLSGDVFEARTDALERGAHRIDVVALDRAGNRGAASRTVRVRADTTPPRVTFVEPASASVPPGIVRAVIDLEDRESGLAAETLRVSLDGEPLPLPPGALDAARGRVTLFLPSLRAGSQHALVVEVEDREGNRARAVRELLPRK